MKKLLFAGVCSMTLTLGVSAANADGMSSTNNWAGLNISGAIGYGETDLDFLSNPATGQNPAGFMDIAGIGAGVEHKSNGVVGGGSIGYNFQMDNFVLGPEVGILTGDFTETSASPFDDVHRTRIDLLFSVVARLGFAFDDFLAYAKFGYAGGSIDLRVTDTVGAGTGTYQDNRWHSGITAGAGIQMRVWENLSLGAEYSYFNLEERRHSDSSIAGIAAGPATVDVDPGDIHVIMAKATWNLGQIFE